MGKSRKIADITNLASVKKVHIFKPCPQNVVNTRFEQRDGKSRNSNSEVMESKVKSPWELGLSHFSNIYDTYLNNLQNVMVTVIVSANSLTGITDPW